MPRLVELAADIAGDLIEQSFDRVKKALEQIHSCLMKLGLSKEQSDKCCCFEEKEEEAPIKAKEPKAAPVPTVDPADSIQKDKVICLECGAKFTMLTGNHLKSHGLTSREYKQKHGMKLGTKLMATNEVKRRSKTAKARGVSKGLKEYQAKKKAAKKG